MLFRISFARLIVTVLLSSCASFAATQNEEPVAVPNDEGLAAAVAHPAPVYTEMAKRLKLKGHVEIAAFVDKQGNVFDTIIVYGNPLLAEMSVDAVKKWTFKPFHDENGRPSKAMVHLRFNLAPPAK